jgi:hypothetical protein
VHLANCQTVCSLCRAPSASITNLLCGVLREEWWQGADIVRGLMLSGHKLRRKGAWLSAVTTAGVRILDVYTSMCSAGRKQRWCRAGSRCLSAAPAESTCGCWPWTPLPMSAVGCVSVTLVQVPYEA